MKKTPRSRGDTGEEKNERKEVKGEKKRWIGDKGEGERVANHRQITDKSQTNDIIIRGLLFLVLFYNKRQSLPVLYS
ncbi:MAG: hypothetical protein NZ901_09995 [Geminocystis sp.]|nr:hypothetical protein [Geminocystis sp.]HIK37388.1 hypothetical protein [Geminocystis sp. M7585_C2015_104]MCS7148505.1 hypothetical protein [Geminocystis sp.]MCX8079461.1 hypothetical protein [Geminocystis sp.]MDW8114922.1 hypothetical protein [Geminocystis sp.]